MERKWMYRFMDLAHLVATWSKDPSTKTGAVIIAPDQRIVSTGYNGYPRNIIGENLDIREIKYEKIIHAEVNALLYAMEPLAGHSIFCTHYPCARCAALIIQSGIKQVYAPEMTEEFLTRWLDSNKISDAMFQEAEVEQFILRDYNNPIAPK